jgi:ABC-type uncharacterized transport system involved in gliding motility auxiliary subunit
VRSKNSLFGLIGLVLLVFAAVAAFLTRASTGVDVLYIAVNAVLGAFALVAYFSAGFEQLREVIGQRSTRYGANTLVGSLLFIAILALVNYLSVRHHHRFDLTEQGVYSLSPQSRSVVENLSKDLQVRAFVEGGIQPQLEELLGTYAYASERVSYELIDPDRHPELAEKYQIRAYGTVHLEYGDESTSVTEPSEESITNGIIKITRETKRTVCFIEGHAEPDLDNLQDARGMAAFKQALENEHYEVKKVLLATMADVPEDCSATVIAGPRRPYLTSELGALEAYLDGGGRLLAFLPPQSGDELQPLLAQWGVNAEAGVVVDQVLRLFQGPALGLAPIAETYAPHEITRDLKQRTVFPMTRPVRAATTPKPGLQVVELVKTSPSSWAETDLDALFQRSEATFDAGNDSQGPIPVAVAANADLSQQAGGETGTSRLVVYGSVEFAQNREFEGTFYNRDLILNSVAWLVGEADLVSIRPSSIRTSRVQFTAQQGTVIFYLSVLLIPQILLLAGIAVWWRRE